MVDSGDSTVVFMWVISQQTHLGPSLSIMFCYNTTQNKSTEAIRCSRIDLDVSVSWGLLHSYEMNECHQTDIKKKNNHAIHHTLDQRCYSFGTGSIQWLGPVEPSLMAHVRYIWNEGSVLYLLPYVGMIFLYLCIKHRPCLVQVGTSSRISTWNGHWYHPLLSWLQRREKRGILEKTRFVLQCHHTNMVI